MISCCNKHDMSMSFIISFGLVKGFNLIKCGVINMNIMTKYLYES